MHLRVQTVSCHFAHFGQHSGYQRFVRYLASNDCDVRSLELESLTKIELERQEMDYFNRPKDSLAQQLFFQVRHRNYRKDFPRREVATCWDACSHGIDVLHHLYSEDTLWLSPAIVKLRRALGRAPILVGTFHLPPREYTYSGYPRLVARLMDHVVVLTQGQAAYFASILPREDISVIPHGIDAEFFSPTSEAIPSHDFHILTVGHTARAFDVLFQTAAAFQERNWTRFRFHLVTWGVRVPSQLRNVTLYAGLSDRELRDLYRRCHLLFLPLHAATANNALLEGMACGLPAVVTDLPAIREYASSGEAVLVGSNDLAGFASAIRQLADDDQTRRTMGVAARRRAMDVSLPSIAARYRQLYHRLVTERRR